MSRDSRLMPDRGETGTGSIGEADESGGAEGNRHSERTSIMITHIRPADAPEKAGGLFGGQG